jgi:hyperosmotically inducible periplasmic protein
MVSRTVQALVISSMCSLIIVPVMAQTAPDNTKVNKRDRAKGAPTADQQKENGGDRDLTQKIRQSIMKDKSLSTYAHNVKVIVQGGQVTLKGPVRSEDEKRTIDTIANEVAGNGHVTNELTVAPTRSKSRNR